jgi:hypothetical protein
MKYNRASLDRAKFPQLELHELAELNHCVTGNPMYQANIRQQIPWSIKRIEV